MVKVQPENAGTIKTTMLLAKTGDLSVDTDVSPYVVAPCSLTITSVRAICKTAPVGASIIVDINKNGTTIFTTQDNRPTIADGETVESGTTPDVTSLSEGDYLSLDVDQVGSGTAGADITVEIICTQTAEIQGASISGSGGGHGAYDYLMYETSSGSGVYVVEDFEGNIIYGGASDAGGVDGADAAECWNAVGASFLFVLPGTFTVSERIVPVENQHVKGSGTGLTIFELANGVNDVMVANDNAGGSVWDSNIVIEDLTLNANGDNQTSGTHIRSSNTSTLYFDHAEYFMLRNVEITEGRDYNLRLGFSEAAGYCRYGLIIDCKIHTTFVEDPAGNSDGWGMEITYIGCEAWGSERDGFTHWGERISWIDCKSHNNAHDGFYAEGTTTADYSTGFVWINCHAWANTMDGMKIDKVSNFTVVACNFYENFDHGVVLRSSGASDYYVYKGKFIGCSVYDNNQDAGGGNQYGFDIDGYVKDVTLDGCHIFNTTAGGAALQTRHIITYNNVTYLTITNCLFENCNYQCVYMGSSVTYAFIDHNRFRDFGNEAILLMSGCSYNQITWNFFSDNAAEAVDFDAGANSNIFFFNDLTNIVASPKLTNDGTSNRFFKNFGYVTENQVLSGTIAVDSTGYKTVTVSHGCSYTPSAQDIQVTLVEDTDVDDYYVSQPKVRDISSTQLTIQTYVIAASSTGSSTAKFAVKISKE